MKYGIKLHYVDDIPGFRDRWDEYEWFETESERDARYENIMHPEERNQSPKDQMTEMQTKRMLGGEGYNILSSVSKIEE